jgi:hypothetical protein
VRRGAGILGLVLVLAAIPAASSAQDAGSADGGFVGYQASASGEAISAFPTLPALLPVKVPFEATLALATATLSSGGQGFGRASTFYPGSLTTGVRPLIETAGGVRLPIPDYPLVVESREFEPARHAEVPGITMTSDVVPTRASAAADAGALDIPAVVTVHALRTESTTTLGTDTITATSTTTVQGLSIAGTVSIGSIVSTASVTSDGTRSTCRGGVAIHDVTVADTKATLDDDGLHVDGKATAPGLGAGKLVAALLQQSGITARVLGGDSACTGANGSRTTAGVLVSFPLPALGSVPAGGGLSFVVGSTSATAGGSTIAAEPAGPVGGDDGGATVPFVPDAFGSDGFGAPGGLTVPPAVTPSRPTGLDTTPAAAPFAYDGVPLSLLAGLVLLALAASGRLRRYMDRIIGLLGP